MNCGDLLTVAIFLVRWTLAVLSGVELELFWQAVRSVAVKCSQGPLG